MSLQPATPNGSLPGTQGDPSTERRQMVLLTAATGCVAAAGVAVPLVSSLAPSERARAMGAGVEVDISDLPPGGVKTVEWRGKPVWIMRRTPEMLAALPQQDAALADPASRKDQQPEYARNPQRSIRPEVFVTVGICTHRPMAGWFLLPLPRLHLRPGGPRLQEQARAHQPGGAAAPLCVRHPVAHRGRRGLSDGSRLGGRIAGSASRHTCFCCHSTSSTCWVARSTGPARWAMPRGRHSRGCTGSMRMRGSSGVAVEASCGSNVAP